MSQKQRPENLTHDATARVGVVGALRAAAANAGVSAVQPAHSKLDGPFLTHPRRVLLRDPSSLHRRAPTSAVKSP